MGTIPDKIETWQMVQPWKKEDDKTIPGIIERKTIDMPPLNPGEAMVEIAGCGVCHTDLGYFYDGVPTVQKPPLTLGHEISGRNTSLVFAANGHRRRSLPVIPVTDGGFLDLL